jgi:hypothetical protein
VVGKCSDFDSGEGLDLGGSFCRGRSCVPDHPLISKSHVKYQRK